MIKKPNFNTNGRLTVDRFDFEDHINGFNDKLKHNANIIELDPPLSIDGTNFDNLNNALFKLNDQILNFDFRKATVGLTDLNLGIIKISGDISGVYDNISVIGLNGTPIGNLSSVSTNDVLMWDGYHWSNKPSIPNSTASGDLSGIYPNPTVIDLTISGQQKGDILYFNSTWQRLTANSDFVLKSNGPGVLPTYVSTTTFPLNSPASGILSGSFPNPYFLTGSVEKEKIVQIPAKTIICSKPNSSTMEALSYGMGIESSENKLKFSRVSFTKMEEHFLINSYIHFKPLLFTSGTTSFVAASSTEFSSVVIASASSINSGAALRTDQILVRISGNECFVCKFKFVSNSNITTIMGFNNGTTISSVTRGIFLQVLGNGQTTLNCVNADGSFSSSTFTLTANIYYNIEIMIKKPVNSIYCNIYSSTGSLITTLVVNFAESASFYSSTLYAGITSQISTATATNLVFVDYMAVLKYY